MSNRIFTSDDQFKKLIELLKSMGVRTISADFSGYGDSGNFDSAMYQIAGDVSLDTVKNALMDWTVDVGKYDYVSNTWSNELVTRNMRVEDIVDLILDRSVDETGMDWYNNGGGQGTVLIDLTGEEPKFEIDMEINRTEIDTFHFDVNMSDGSLQ